MNSIVTALKQMEAEAGKSGRWNLETLCKMAALEIETKAATIARLTAANENERKLNDTAFTDNMAALNAMKELLIKAESALTYANWDGEFSKQATAQDVINARDAIRAHLEAK